MLVLPHRERIGGEVGYVRVSLFRWHRIVGQRPSDMRPEESLLDVVGVPFLIHEPVMRAMAGRPTQRRFLDRGGSEEEIEKLDDPVTFIAAVRVVVMIARVDGEASAAQHESK